MGGSDSGEGVCVQGRDTQHCLERKHQKGREKGLGEGHRVRRGGDGETKGERKACREKGEIG